MKRHFDKELKALKDELIEMGRMVEISIVWAIEALKKQDVGLAGKIIEDDKVIDEFELSIDERCVDLIALHQPMAGDLRFITYTAKINADLERIADLSVDIAQRVIELADKPLLKPLIDIPKLSLLAQEMVKKAIASFVRNDAGLAKEVVLSDREADKLRNEIQKELIYDYMVKDGTTSPQAVPLLLIARHLERICDHATNIAEDTIYIVKAKVVKHHPEKLKNGE